MTYLIDLMISMYKYFVILFLIYFMMYY